MAMTWKRVGSDWVLFADRRVVGRVVPDAHHRGMWRVALPGGLSDLVNLTRAKDAALARAMGRIEPRRNGAEIEKKASKNQGAFLASSPPMRSKRARVPQVARNDEMHQRAPQGPVRYGDTVAS